jgi:hypothetical protein
MISSVYHGREWRVSVQHEMTLDETKHAFPSLDLSELDPQDHVLDTRISYEINPRWIRDVVSLVSDPAELTRAGDPFALNLLVRFQVSHCPGPFLEKLGLSLAIFDRVSFLRRCRFVCAFFYDMLCAFFQFLTSQSHLSKSLARLPCALSLMTRF